jgi:hypothetical protein
VAARPRMLKNMFLDFQALQIDVRHLAEWDIALWVRSRVNGGAKTAGSTARSALMLAERCTDENFYAESALVKSQAAPAQEARASADPPKPASPLKWGHIEGLEGAIMMGKTVQQRILAGFFTFLVHTSHRTKNGQRSRKIRLTEDAIMGESLLKGRPTWTKWAASRTGLTVNDWAAPWLEELASCDLPGPDYIILAPNATLDAWLPRPAEYRDFSRALHLLLMIYCGESPNSVVDYTPHGCRHVMVTAGTQLVAQGLLKTSSLETLGHWEKGSKMPGLYNSAACVTELQTRSTIAETLRTGWRPATDGNLITPATPVMERTMMPRTPMASIVTPKMGTMVEATAVMPETATQVPEDKSKILVVVNTQRKMAHRVKLPSEVSLCMWYTCGSPDKPAHNAKFTSVGSARKCSKCFGCNWM